MTKYKIKFFSIKDNKNVSKHIDEYAEFAMLYYQLLQSKWVKDLKAFKYSSFDKDYREVINV